MLLVLSVPSVNDSYYKKHFHKMIDFYIAYANAVNGRDNVVVLADKKTMPYLKGRVPNENLLITEESLDAWVRDVSPVLPGKCIQFRYSGGLKSKEAKYLQKQFNLFLERHQIDYTKIDLINDGGNIVDNGKDCVITTNKFLQLNNLNEADAIETLSKVLDVKHVAIIEADDEKLGHCDGMCSFLDEKTLLLVNYDHDEKFRLKIKRKLENYLPSNIEIKEIECGQSSSKAKGGFASAYGLYVNCVPTEKFIYVPTFQDELDDVAKLLFRRYAGDKECVFVDACNVCDLGGSLRCLTWQVMGRNAEKLINAAKTSAPL